MSTGTLRLGGMALRNGLLIHGPSHWAAAVRTPAGEVKVASGPKPRLRRFDHLPGVRGVARLAEAVAVVPLVKRALPEARLPFQDLSVAAVAGTTTLAGAIVRRRTRGVAGEAAVAALSLAPAIFALRGGELAAYHGAEHKTIGAYETGGEDSAKEHDRCGSHLVAPLLVANVAGTALLKKILEKPNPLAGGAVALASTAVAVEVFAWCERNPESLAAQAIRSPGFALQRTLGTREPDEAQLEVGRAALDEILRLEDH